MPIARSVNSIGVTEIGHLGPAIRSEIAKKTSFVPGQGPGKLLVNFMSISDGIKH